jgi:hypothetical protein
VGSGAVQAKVFCRRLSARSETKDFWGTLGTEEGTFRSMTVWRRGWDNPQALSAQFYLFIDMHDKPHEYRRFSGFHSFNAFNCFHHILPISALNRHQRHQNNPLDLPALLCCLGVVAQSQWKESRLYLQVDAGIRGETARCGDSFRGPVVRQNSHLLYRQHPKSADRICIQV